MTLTQSYITNLIELGLSEDIGSGDVTTDSIFDTKHQSDAFLKVKASGIIAGMDIARQVFEKLDANVAWNPECEEGEKVESGRILVRFSGKTRALLTGERLALNILQHLSGIATRTAQYVDAVGKSNTIILDTRKTLPGLRPLQKYAVAIGRGQNHRFGLYDGIMIKDNHINLGKGISQVSEKVKQARIEGLEIEVETSNLDEVREALTAGADIIMLDNMSNEMMYEAVALINGKAKTEASGGITLERVASVAATGVDYISIGELTHSVTALDVGMYFT